MTDHELNILSIVIGSVTLFFTICSILIGRYYARKQIRFSHESNLSQINRFVSYVKKHNGIDYILQHTNDSQLGRGFHSLLNSLDRNYDPRFQKLDLVFKQWNDYDQLQCGVNLSEENQKIVKQIYKTCIKIQKSVK